MGQKLTSDSRAKGSLSSDEGDGNVNGYKPIGLDWQNKQLCTCITLFLYRGSVSSVGRAC